MKCHRDFCHFVMIIGNCFEKLHKFVSQCAIRCSLCKSEGLHLHMYPMCLCPSLKHSFFPQQQRQLLLLLIVYMLRNCTYCCSNKPTKGALNKCAYFLYPRDMATEKKYEVEKPQDFKVEK